MYPIGRVGLSCEGLVLMNALSPISRAQDKTVLEAAYNSNPKPDKLARLAIVRRVSLTEKEVQVRLPH